MRRFHLRPRVTICLALALVLGVGIVPALATELVQLTESNWDEFVPHGKEVDCIYGDWVLRNDHLVAVIAEAIPTRNANMTVRNVGGSVIDLTVRDLQSDQLSAYYPLGTRYKLAGPSLSRKDRSVQISFRGPAKDERSTAQVTYALPNDARWLKITTRITNTSDKPLELNLVDSIRADGEFEFGTQDDLGLFWAYDPYWRQAYGALLADPAWHFATGQLKRGSRPALPIEKKGAGAEPLPPGESRDIVRYLFPAANTIEVIALANELRGKSLVTVAWQA